MSRYRRAQDRRRGVFYTLAVDDRGSDLLIRFGE
jgi:hypothetical protein